jgi:hypothetical protein
MGNECATTIARNLAGFPGRSEIIVGWSRATGTDRAAGHACPLAGGDGKLDVNATPQQIIRNVINSRATHLPTSGSDSRSWIFDLLHPDQNHDPRAGIGRHTSSEKSSAKSWQNPRTVHQRNRVELVRRGRQTGQRGRHIEIQHDRQRAVLLSSRSIRSMPRQIPPIGRNNR